MTIVYAVFKEGMFRHECGGIFDTEQQARDAADALKKNECDDYHQFVVLPFHINAVTPAQPFEFYTRLCEPGTIYQVGQFK